MGTCIARDRPSRAGALATDRQRGFTLLEVLVALAIVATTLAAGMRAIASLTVNSQDLREATEASWSAASRLAEIAIAREWPEPGSLRFPCPQGDIAFDCEQQVAPTPNRHFRRVEVIVRSPARQDHVVARLSRIVSDAP